MHRVPMTATRIVLLFALGLVSACSPAASDAPLRSPSRDYRPPAPSTSDGRIVGADGVDPRDRLEEGPAVGRENGAAPGWTVDKKGPRFDPKKRVGGDIDRPENEH
jgi:hypothetical protein